MFEIYLYEFKIKGVFGKNIGFKVLTTNDKHCVQMKFPIVVVFGKPKQFVAEFPTFYIQFLRDSVTCPKRILKPLTLSLTLLKYVNTARFSKYVWPFFNIINERVKFRKLFRFKSIWLSKQINYNKNSGKEKAIKKKEKERRSTKYGVPERFLILTTISFIIF